MLGLSLPCLYACGSTVLFVLGNVLRGAQNITKNMKNLLELAKVLDVYDLLIVAQYANIYAPMMGFSHHNATTSETVPHKRMAYCISRRGCSIMQQRGAA